MKKFILILLVVLSVPFIAKSQTDTVKIPAAVAKEIVKDLVSCDSSKAMLVVTKEELDLTKKKVVLKDSIITEHVRKGGLYEERIRNEQSKYQLQGEWVDQLKKENKDLRVKNTFLRITATAIIGALSYLYLNK